ncbi:hypothetical protein DFS34DRAFT_647129 [Phlyctochytrium arcticum]|nr:hypothetical protein DFS34DRAFT_647129 [Phlyctochytrium arcticum]
MNGMDHLLPTLLRQLPAEMQQQLLQGQQQQQQQQPENAGGIGSGFEGLVSGGAASGGGGGGAAGAFVENHTNPQQLELMLRVLEAERQRQEEIRRTKELELEILRLREKQGASSSPATTTSIGSQASQRPLTPPRTAENNQDQCMLSSACDAAAQAIEGVLRQDVPPVTSHLSQQLRNANQHSYATPFPRDPTSSLAEPASSISTAASQPSDPSSNWTSGPTAYLRAINTSNANATESDQSIPMSLDNAPPHFMDLRPPTSFSPSSSIAGSTAPNSANSNPTSTPTPASIASPAINLLSVDIGGHSREFPTPPPAAFASGYDSPLTMPAAFPTDFGYDGQFDASDGSGYNWDDLLATPGTSVSGGGPSDEDLTLTSGMLLSDFDGQQQWASNMLHQQQQQQQHQHHQQLAFYQQQQQHQQQRAFHSHMQHPHQASPQQSPESYYLALQQQQQQQSHQQSISHQQQHHQQQQQQQQLQSSHLDQHALARHQQMSAQALRHLPATYISQNGQHSLMGHSGAGYPSAAAVAVSMRANSGNLQQQQRRPTLPGGKPRHTASPTTHSPTVPGQIRLPHRDSSSSVTSQLNGSITATAGRKKIIEEDVLCKRCLTHVATFLLHPETKNPPTPACKISLLCTSCEAQQQCASVPSLTTPPSSSTSSSTTTTANPPIDESSSRKKRIHDEYGLECEVCKRRVGAGGFLFPGGRGELRCIGVGGKVRDEAGVMIPEAMDFRVEPICVSCRVKYKFCTECGGGGKFRTGKYRPVELFASNRRTCLLSHVRLGGAPVTYETFLSPSQVSPKLYNESREVHMDGFYGLYAAPEVIEAPILQLESYPLVEYWAAQSWKAAERLLREDYEHDAQAPRKRYLSVVYVEKPQSRVRGATIKRIKANAKNPNSTGPTDPSSLAAATLSTPPTPPMNPEYPVTPLLDDSLTPTLTASPTPQDPDSTTLQATAAAQAEEEDTSPRIQVAYASGEWSLPHSTLLIATHYVRTITVSTLPILRGMHERLLRRCLRDSHSPHYAASYPPIRHVHLVVRRDHLRMQTYVERMGFKPVDDYISLNPGVNPAIFDPTGTGTEVGGTGGVPAKVYCCSVSDFLKGAGGGLTGGGPEMDVDRDV